MELLVSLLLPESGYSSFETINTSAHGICFSYKIMHVRGRTRLLYFLQECQDYQSVPDANGKTNDNMLVLRELSIYRGTLSYSYCQLSSVPPLFCQFYIIHLKIQHIHHHLPENHSSLEMEKPSSAKKGNLQNSYVPISSFRVFNIFSSRFFLYIDRLLFL
jgi:hypothetical protein